MRKFSAMDAGLIIDRCTKCKGIWFDGGEMGQFLQSEDLKDNFLEPAEAPAISVDIDRNCPRCATAMARPIVGGVTLDRCEGCSGIWFDHGELNTLVNAFESHQLESEGSTIVEELREGLEAGEMSENVLIGLVESVKFLVAKVRPPKAATPPAEAAPTEE